MLQAFADADWKAASSIIVEGSLPCGIKLLFDYGDHHSITYANGHYRYSWSELLSFSKTIELYPFNFRPVILITEKDMKLKAAAALDRDDILGIAPKAQYFGGIEHFDGASVDTIDRLIALGYADTNDAQNSAPTLGQIRDFMSEYPRFRAHGYVVSHDRHDCRTTIEGVELAGAITDEERKAFRKLFSDADEYSITASGARCWYD